MSFSQWDVGEVNVCQFQAYPIKMSDSNFYIFFYLHKKEDSEDLEGGGKRQKELRSLHHHLLESHVEEDT